MSATSTAQGRAITVCAIVLLGLNLRPVLATISPLLDAIQAGTGVSDTVAGLLTTLPILAMGLGALSGAALHRTIGERWGITLGIVVIGLACLLRWIGPGIGGLLLTAVLAGLGIAIIQALLPYFIKRTFTADPSRIMGLYVTAIMAGAAIGSAAAPRLSLSNGWAFALGIWLVPAFAAALLWQPVALQNRMQSAFHSAVALDSPHTNLWRQPRTWTLTLFFAGGTGIFTLLLAWLPPYYTSLGWSPSAAGLMMGGITLTEVCAGLAISAWINRFPDRRGPLLFVLICLLAGAILLIFAPAAMAALTAVLLGIGVGSLFPLTLIVTIDHRQNPAEAGALASAVQGGGYLVASLMPLIAGVVRDQVSDLTPVWWGTASGVVILMFVAMRFAPSTYRHTTAE